MPTDHVKVNGVYSNKSKKLKQKSLKEIAEKQNIYALSLMSRNVRINYLKTLFLKEKSIVYKWQRKEIEQTLITHLMKIISEKDGEKIEPVEEPKIAVPDEEEEKSLIPEFKKKEVDPNKKPSKADKKWQPKGFVGEIDEDDDGGQNKLNAVDPIETGDIKLSVLIEKKLPIQIKNRMTEAQSQTVIDLLAFLGYDTNNILVIDIAEIREFIVN